jgi:TrmH family RNA methyltransferase
MLTSPSNPRIKSLKSLRVKKVREKEKKLLVEGFHLLAEAASASGHDIELVVMTEKASGSSEGEALKKGLSGAGIEVLLISEKVSRDISEVDAPQGVFAVVKYPGHELHEVLYSDRPLVVVCSGIQDPGNLGTIIRTAHAAGASGVIVSSGTVDPYNEKVLRSTMGSIFHIPVVCADDASEVLGKLKAAGLKIVAADTNGASLIWQADLRGPVAIIFGSEGKGLTDQLRALCDLAVSIPMPGGAESLNVAVSGAVIMYEVLRQRLYGSAGIQVN